MLFSKTLIAEAEAQPDYWHGIFKRVCSTPDGRKLFIWILENSGVFDVAKHVTPDVAMWMDGRRSLPLEMMQILNIDPKDVFFDGDKVESTIEERMSYDGRDN